MKSLCYMIRGRDESIQPSKHKFALEIKTPIVSKDKLKHHPPKQVFSSVARLSKMMGGGIV